MPTLVTRSTGKQIRAVDVNQLVEAFEVDHIGDAGDSNYHADYIHLGLPSANTDRGVIANLLSGPARLEFNEAMDLWGQRIRDGDFEPFVSGGVFDVLTYTKHVELANSMWLKDFDDTAFDTSNPVYMRGGAVTPLQYQIGRRRGSPGSEDQVLVCGLLGVVDMDTVIDRDDDGNMTLMDAVAGTLTLAHLSQGEAERFASPPYGVTYDPDLNVGGGGNTLTDGAYDATDHHNYYSWSSTGGALIKVLKVLRFRLPDVLTSFDSIKVFHKADGTVSESKIDVALLDTAGSAAGLTGATGLNSATWAQATVTVTSGTFTPGGYVTLQVTLWAASSKTAFVGEVELNYT